MFSFSESLKNLYKSNLHQFIRTYFGEIYNGIIVMSSTDFCIFIVFFIFAPKTT